MSAAFQSAVFLQQGFGVPGELFDDSPRRSQSFILNSVSAANNVFGRGFSVVSQGIAQCGNPSGTGVFAGILVNPKTHASFGDTVNPLNPILQLPNNVQASLLTMGSIIVTLPAGAAIGDYVIMDNTTGALSTITPGTALPGGKSFVYGMVDRYTITGAGLAVITLTPPTPPIAA